MILTYKMLNGLVDIDTNELTPVLQGFTGTRSHNQQLKGKLPNTVMRKSFYTNRIIEPWNTLSRHTIDSNSVEVFKVRYDKERLGSYI